jgi:hypothetical protein
MKHILFILCLFLPSMAQADYVVWSDPQTKLTATYPDTWEEGSNKTTDDLLTVLIPSGGDNAQCVLKSAEDKRFVILPNKTRSDVQKRFFSREFMDEYARQYPEGRVVRFKDGTGLGLGFASTAVIAFAPPVDEPFQPRMAIVSVSNYYDRTYVAECSAEANNFQNYTEGFFSFLKTVNFKKEFHELMIGNYREFLETKGILNLPLPNGVSRTVH